MAGLDSGLLKVLSVCIYTQTRLKKRQTKDFKERRFTHTFLQRKSPTFLLKSLAASVARGRLPHSLTGFCCLNEVTSLLHPEPLIVRGKKFTQNDKYCFV